MNALNIARVFPLLFLIIGSVSGQNCLPNGITFFEQSEVDFFKSHYPGCTSIGGNINIKNTKITNLDGLNVLKEVKGSIIIDNNLRLKSISGLNKLITINGALEIKNNDSIITADISALETAGAIIIHNNAQLSKIQDLSSLKQISGDFSFQDNTSLALIGDCPQLIRIGASLRMVNNKALKQIPDCPKLRAITKNLLVQKSDSILQISDRFPSLDTIKGILDFTKNLHLELLNDFNILKFSGGINLVNNPLLSLARSFIALNTITGNLDCSDLPKLQQLPKFEALNKIISGDLVIDNNDSLSNFSETFNSLQSVDGKISIINNKSIIDFAGFEKLLTVNKGIVINNNIRLRSLKGFENISKIGSVLDISYNISLQNIEALSKLASVEGGYITILNNENLLSLKGLESLKSDAISNLIIQDCKNLSNCAARSVCSMIESKPNNVFIGMNAAGCNSNTEVIRTCIVNTKHDNYGRNAIGKTMLVEDFIFIDDLFKTQEIDIIDIHGRIAHKLSPSQISDGMISVKILPSGMYFLKSGLFLQRIIKQ